MIAIVDYGAGNLRSVANAIAKLSYKPTVTSNPGDLFGATAVILPGVGAAADTMLNLERLGLSEAIRRVVADGTPMLAICVGMQVLFDETEEGGRHRCRPPSSVSSKRTCIPTQTASIGTPSATTRRIASEKPSLSRFCIVSAAAPTPGRMTAAAPSRSPGLLVTLGW